MLEREKVSGAAAQVESVTPHVSKQGRSNYDEFCIPGSNSNPNESLSRSDWIAKNRTAEFVDR
jgi:hypothetical protein